MYLCNLSLLASWGHRCSCWSTLRGGVLTSGGRWFWDDRNKPIPGCFLGHQWKRSCSLAFLVKREESGHRSLVSVSNGKSGTLGKGHRQCWLFLTIPQIAVAPASYNLHLGSRMLCPDVHTSTDTKPSVSSQPELPKHGTPNVLFWTQVPWGMGGRLCSLPVLHQTIRLLYSCFTSGHIYAILFHHWPVVVHAPFLK